MEILKFEGVKELKIDFLDVRYGLIYFRLRLGEKSYETRFSDVFDPLLDFKRWLEAISIGINQCSFWFDTEGEDIKFNFEQLTYEREVFSASPYYDDKVYISDYIDRRQLVEAFYLGLLEFYHGSALLKENWEIEYLWERLSGILDLGYETLLAELTKLEREELKKILFKANPGYLVSCPTAPEVEAFGYLIGDLKHNKSG